MWDPVLVVLTKAAAVPDATNERTSFQQRSKVRKHDKSRPRDGIDAVKVEAKPEVILGDLYLRGFFVSLFDWNEASTTK